MWANMALPYLDLTLPYLDIMATWQNVIVIRLVLWSQQQLTQTDFVALSPENHDHDS